LHSIKTSSKETFEADTSVLLQLLIIVHQCEVVYL